MKRSAASGRVKVLFPGVPGASARASKGTGEPGAPSPWRATSTPFSQAAKPSLQLTVSEATRAPERRSARVRSSRSKAPRMENVV